jgi:hypothetical protein
MLVCPYTTEKTGWAQERVRIAPASGGVELQELYIVRSTALDAAKEADLTNMKLGLWFTADWKMDKRSPPLVHLQSLNAIEDDSGRLLSTPSRLKQVEFLRGEVRSNEWRSSGGKEGPVIDMLLDAPGRGAAKLKSIKGKARVSLTKQVILRFDQLPAINGKVLEHADMKGLAAMKLRFSVEEKDGDVSATVSAPVNYASPWNRGRLFDWDLLEGEKELRLSSEAVSPDGEGVSVEKTYRRRTIKGVSLRLVVLDDVESKDFSFDFQNVELP